MCSAADIALSYIYDNIIIVKPELSTGSLLQQIATNLNWPIERGIVYSVLVSYQYLDGCTISRHYQLMY